jgi:hypothetical protein
MYNLFKFIEDKKSQYKVPFKAKVIYDPNSLTKEDLNVKGNLNLSITSIYSLPNGLKVEGNLYLINCPNLQSLPNGLEVGGNLDLGNCPSLQSLPNGLEVGGNLDLRYCTSLQSLPNDLKVEGDLYLGSTPLSEKYTEKEIKAMVPGVKGDIY